MFSPAIIRQTARRATARMFSDTSHKPMIDIYGIPARYANATYVAASKAGILEQVENELLALQQTAQTNAAFAGLLENPLISRANKVSKMTELLSEKASTTTLNLMTTLAGNARLNELDKIVSTFSELMKAKRGIVEATITSAESLTKAQTDAIQKAMKAQVGEGKQVMLTSKVDPSIIGGLQVQIGDKFLDLSVASKINVISRLPV
mmetsp:Transcript_14752/g.16898  ORF Transcript_14752/g.16898 Transcript_14752/m.16898 type:complete len:207 (+) Transcript_14752:73-693(+)